MASISPDSKKWQAEADLQTMIEYQKICKDKSRHQAAMAMKREKMKALAGLEEGKMKKESA